MRTGWRVYGGERVGKEGQTHEETGGANTVEPRKIFPQPQLQQTPVVDLRTIRVEEDKVLNRYGWVDQKKGLVRIPIDQAIEVFANLWLGARPVRRLEQHVDGLVELLLGRVHVAQFELFLSGLEMTIGLGDEGGAGEEDQRIAVRVAGTDAAAFELDSTVELVQSTVDRQSQAQRLTVTCEDLPT